MLARGPKKFALTVRARSIDIKVEGSLLRASFRGATVPGGSIVWHCRARGSSRGCGPSRSETTTRLVLWGSHRPLQAASPGPPQGHEGAREGAREGERERGGLGVYALGALNAVAGLKGATAPGRSLVPPRPRP